MQGGVLADEDALGGELTAMDAMISTGIVGVDANYEQPEGLEEEAAPLDDADDFASLLRGFEAALGDDAELSLYNTDDEAKDNTPFFVISKDWSWLLCFETEL